MEGANTSTFRPTLTVWPAEPPSLPPVVVEELRRLPGAEFISWDPHPNPPRTEVLPEDFCLRECLVTDPDDLDAVFDLVSRWGRLTPLESHLRSPFDSLPAGLDWLVPQIADETNRKALRRLAPAAENHGPSSPRAHSLLLEAHYLRVLQDPDRPCDPQCSG